MDPINRNFNRAIKFTQPIRDSFDKNALYVNPKVLISYYKKLIDTCIEGTISHRDTAFLIADTVWFEAVSYNPDVEAIVVVAAELEMADEPNVCPSSQKLWNNLVMVINHQDRIYQSE